MIIYGNWVKIKIKVTVFFLRNNNKDRCDEQNVNVEVVITGIILFKAFSSILIYPHLISLNNRSYNAKFCTLIYEHMFSFILAFISLKSNYEWPVDYLVCHGGLYEFAFYDLWKNCLMKLIRDFFKVFCVKYLNILLNVNESFLFILRRILD